MKKLILSITILTISIFLGLTINSPSTSAKQKDPLDLINKISYMHAPDCGNHNNPYNSTLFTVTFKWGKGCNSSICDEINGTFHCVDPGDKCTTTSHAHSGSISVSHGSCPSSVSSNKWDCYDVYIPVDGSYQDARGKIKRLKEFDLTFVAVDINTGYRLDGVAGLAPRTTTVFYGNTASLSRGYTNTGYTFVGWAGGGSGDVYSRVMKSDYVITAYYKGESGTSSTDIKVKNNDVTKYGNLEKVTYAKPGTIDNPNGDTLTYTAWYDAGAQTAVKWRPQYVQIGRNGGWSGACGGNNTSLTLNALFNQCRGGYNSWNNAFSVTKENFKTYTDPLDYTGYGIGVTTGETAGKSNEHVVVPQEVGTALKEHAVTNRNDNYTVWSTPKSYYIGLTGGHYTPSSGKVDITSLDSVAEARVPYNFVNNPHKPNKSSDDPDDTGDDDVNDNSNGKIVYAGEKDTFEFSLDVQPRLNPETDGTYATIVDKAKWRLGLCIGADCNKADNDPTKYNYSKTWGGSDSREDKLNADYKLTGDFGIKKTNLDINIPDLTAGSRICVVAEVFPKTSGDPLNWNNTNYDGTWARSPKSCYTVAKRPSTQAWGGNIYSRGNVNTIPSIKNNLYGYTQYPYKAEAIPGQKVFVFGSWGELGVVSNGAINGFGSGASMGYVTNNGDSTTWPNYQFIGADGTTGSYLGPGNNTPIPIPSEPGGGTTNNYCDRVPLTIPNSSCSSNDTAGGLSSAVGITKAASDKESIVNLLVSGSKSSNHTHSNDSITVDRNTIGASIDGSTTRVLSSNGNITLSAAAGDLIYLNNTYLNYNQMPKLVIYAKGNIYIDCNFNRIDALLIADDTVVTCNNFDGVLTDENVNKHINDQINARQLYINGTIIAKRVIANRTYGAATGANSIIPAEIINFDPTLYQFGGSSEADDDATGRLDMTYIHEIAPRL